MPYHQSYGPGGCVADGLAFSCGYTNNPQPSLRFIEKEVRKTTGSDRISQEKYNLSYLACQGVLLINSSLTVQAGAPNSHQGLWTPFLNYMFKKVVSQKPHGLVYALMGRSAQDSFMPYLRKEDSSVIATHPASAAYKGIEWSSENMFQEINEQLKFMNLKPIEW